SFEILWLTDDNANTMTTLHLIELSDLERRTDSAEVDEGYWSARKFSLSGARSHSGSFSWHELGQNGAAHWIASMTPTLVQPGDSLKFWMWYDIETDWDYFYVHVSIDGGLTFVNLAHPSLTTETNPNGMNLGAGITGASGGWIEAGFDLSGYAGQQIYLRFAYYTDYSVRGEGVYLDDISFVDFYGVEAAPIDFAVGDPVSLTGVADGVHYFVGQLTDDDGQLGPRSAIARVVVDTAPSYVCGDADGGGSVNIGDATFLIEFIFNSGSAPSPAEAGDIDGSGSINIADVTYAIAYIFSSGPAPVCP
ncbi:MAG TPA: choice-of-anchor J domain-containing protein, partial [candidate division Zixibacteria bacterium]|nr:choice-of-anchor J domain-containing protein [candidate division Zixibacteria bacterium]